MVEVLVIQSLPGQGLQLNLVGIAPGDAHFSAEHGSCRTDLEPPDTLGLCGWIIDVEGDSIIMAMSDISFKKPGWIPSGRSHPLLQHPVEKIGLKGGEIELLDTAMYEPGGTLVFFTNPQEVAQQLLLFSVASRKPLQGLPPAKLHKQATGGDDIRILLRQRRATENAPDGAAIILHQEGAPDPVRVPPVAKTLRTKIIGQAQLPDEAKDGFRKLLGIG